MTGIVPDVRRIAVLRAGGLGDFVFALPALESLREAYPGARITLLTGPAQANLVAERPGPWDRLEVVPPFRGVREDEAPHAESVEAFLARMRAEQFDLAVQMHGGGRHSNHLVRMLDARTTVGCRTPDAPRLDRELPHVYLHAEAIRWLEVVALVGGRFRSPAPRLTVTAADRRRAAEVLPPTGTPEVTIHPGAGSTRRRWPVERFAQLGDELARDGYRVLIVGGAQDIELTAGVAAAMRGTKVDLGGRLSLSALVGLFARIALHVGNDSGPAHIARAVAPSTLTLTWGPNLLTAGPIGPADRHRALLGWQIHCPECGAELVGHECDHGSSLIARIAPDEVVEAALALLARMEGSR
ncbi:MAG: glycosyltransferase family 9 protein [Dehalococcoidia bacterium]